MEVRTAGGGTKTAGNWHDGRACVSVKMRGTAGDGRVWMRSAGFG